MAFLPLPPRLMRVGTARDIPGAILLDHESVRMSTIEHALQLLLNAAAERGATLP